MIRAAISVFFRRAAKFRHRQDHHIVHAPAQVRVERGYGCAELLQQVAELPATIAFVNVRIPIQTGRVGESHFQADVSLDQLGNLQQRIAKRRPRILRTVLAVDTAPD